MNRTRVVLVTVWIAIASAVGAWGQGRGFSMRFVSYAYVNGNGALDCGEPVRMEMIYLDPPQDLSTPNITGEMTAPVGATSGFSFIPGSVNVDPLFTTGCTQQVIAGNSSGDTAAKVDFQCGPPSTAGPIQGNVVAFTFDGTFTGSSSTFTVTGHGTTSDGLDQSPSLTKSDGIGAVCQGTPPGVVISKTGAGSGSPGSTELYTITVTDTSGLGLGGLQITDVIPASTAFVASGSTPGWTCPGGGGPGALCRLPAGNLAPNGSVTAFLAVRLDAPLGAGVSNITNTACARSGPSTVLGCASVTTPTSGSPALQVAKTLTSGNGMPGSVVTYDIKVTNAGTQDAGQVAATETVPANTTWVATVGWTCSGSSAGSTCTAIAASSLAVGASVHLGFSVRVDNPLPAGVTSILNTACASTGSQAGVCGTVTVPTDGRPNLQVTKSASGTGAPGTLLSYTVAVQNTGNQDASGVVLTETVPALTTYAGSPAWSCSGVAAGSTCTLTAGTIAASSTFSVAFVVRIDDPLPAGASSVANQVCATGTGVGQSCGGTQTPTTGNPALRVVKTYLGGPVLPGAALPFNVAVDDPGNQNQGPVTVTETVPAHSSFDPTHSDPRWTCGGTAAGSTCTAQLAGLTAGAPAVVLPYALVADSPLAAGTVIGNVACASTTGAVAEGGASKGLGKVVAQACGSVATPAAVDVNATLAASIDHGVVARPGDRIHYELTVPNTSGQVLQDTDIVLQLDANTSLVVGTVVTSSGVVVSGNGPGDLSVHVHSGDIAAGGSIDVRFDVIVSTSLPAAVSQVAAQATVTGINFPSEESGPPPAPSTPGPTPTPVGVVSQVHDVPALSALGLVLLALMLGVGGARAVRRVRGDAS